MAGIFGGAGGSGAYKTTVYTGVQIQTSTAAGVIPLLWGCNLAGTNVIDLNDFSAPPQGKGGKGGGGKAQKDYTTVCSLAVCEGPVQQCNAVYADANTVISPGSLNLTLFDGTLGQAPPAYMVSNHPDKALGYSQTAYFFSSAYDLGSSPYLPNHRFEIIGKYAALTGSPDVNPAQFIPDFIASTQYGADPGAGYIDGPSLSQYFDYCQALGLWMSPYLHTAEQATSILQRWAQLSNSWIFWSGSKLKFVPLGDTEVTANGTTFTPNLQPIYSLTIDDFLFDGTSEDPVQVDRIDPADGYNNVELDIRDRALQYASNPIRWQDQTSVDQYGLLQSVIINAEEVCDSSIAAVMAMLIGKRSSYVRNTYSFKLSGSYVLLEPGDVVTLTEPNMGLANFPVRVTEVQEDEKGELQFKAEELPAAIGTATLYVPQGGSPTTPPDLKADPGDVNPPVIIEPPPLFTNGIAQVWLAASGGPEWGGADVYISADGTHYAWIGKVTQPVQQGVLTAPLPDAAGLDAGNILSLDTTESNQVLSLDVTTADADKFRTASLIDNEILAYGAASATGTFTANLTYLQRGAYGTAHSAHLAGAQFTRLNPAAALVYNLPASYVGQTLYFKFVSFNIFGSGNQQISDAVAYTFTPVGLAFQPTAPRSGLPGSLIALAAVSLAATGTDQGSALAVTAISNMFSTVSAGTGATLPQAVAAMVGQDVTFINDAALDLMIYPFAGDAIGTLGVNVGAPLSGSGHSVTFFCKAVGQWTVS